MPRKSTITFALKAFALAALLAGNPAAQVKYVAVVETEVDAQSGASADINPAEVRQITTELRRQATENLPLDRYNIMTSETVQSMGGAVLEECADENCVITLGSRIGADYIVRGTVSKFQTKFTLSVEMYETENGTLVASSEVVRSQNLEELLDMGTAACGRMYRKFAGANGAMRKNMQESKTESKQEPKTEIAAWKPDAVDTGSMYSGKKNNVDRATAPKSGNSLVVSKDNVTKKRATNDYLSLKYQTPLGTPVPWGGVNVEGGWIWSSGTFFGIDFGWGTSGSSDNNPFADDLTFGLGLSLGRIINLDNQWQFVYGGSMGFWYKGSLSEKKGDVLGPFVKLRWNVLELTYRGLIGYRSLNFHEEDIGWDHQLMLGLYFATSKRDR